MAAVAPHAAASVVLAMLLIARATGSSDDGRVVIIEPEPVAPGEQGELSVTILEPPAAGLPILVRLVSDIVGLPDNRLGQADVVDPQAQLPRLRGRFVAPMQPGRYPVLGQVEYVTCDAKYCRPRRAVITWTVVVTGDEDDEQTGPQVRP